MTYFPYEVIEHALAGFGGVDLHSHSRHSDGHWTPTELVQDARRAGISVLALTDHDTNAGVVEAQAAGVAQGIAVISGAELSVQVGGRLFHVLCFDFDPTSPVWTRIAALRKRCRNRWNEALFARARERGYAVREEAAIDAEGNYVDGALAIALHAAGATPSLPAAESLARSLLWPNPVEHLYADAFELGELLPPNFTVCVVAHPARQEPGVSMRLNENDVYALREALPLVGLEAHHPYHSPSDVARYADLARQHGLLITCGSDAHGHHLRRPPRAHPPEVCAEFLNLILERHGVRAGQ